jgi:hypothetical protein
VVGKVISAKQSKSTGRLISLTIAIGDQKVLLKGEDLQELHVYVPYD